MARKSSTVYKITVNYVCVSQKQHRFMSYNGLYPVTSADRVKIERMTINCTTKTALHNHARKFILTRMANVFTYNTPNRKQFHEETAPTRQVHQLLTSTSNVAFCVTDTYGYRTLANLLRRLAVITTTKELLSANAK
jgi:hypothetical protein